MKNLKRNGLFVLSLLSLSAPLFFQGTITNLPTDQQEIKEAILALTIDPDTNQSLVFQKKDLTTLDEIAKEISNQANQSRTKTYLYFYSAFLLSLVLAGTALLYHEPENPY